METKQPKKRKTSPDKEKKAAPKKIGRPSSFTPELAFVICERIAYGESLRNICKSEDMPASSTVFQWLADPERASFTEQYARARDAQADFYAEQIIQIADDGQNDTYTDDEGKPRVDMDVIARSRLRVDARKWYASKLAPKKYGDKVVQEVTGPDGGPQKHEHKHDVTISAEESYRRMIEAK